VTQVPPGESLLAGSREWPLWFGAAAVIARVSALLSIWLGRAHSTKAKLVWTVIALAVPILGPIAWFVLGRQGRRSAVGRGSAADQEGGRG
jgi:hypothetical protein